MLAVFLIIDGKLIGVSEHTRRTVKRHVMSVDVSSFLCRVPLKFIEQLSLCFQRSNPPHHPPDQPAKGGGCLPVPRAANRRCSEGWLSPLGRPANKPSIPMCSSGSSYSMARPFLTVVNFTALRRLPIYSSH